MDIKTVLEADVKSGLPDLKKRKVELPRTTARKIIALCGPRRSGKTYILYQAAKDAGSWYFVNFEDERLGPGISLLGEICAYVSGKGKNLFLDEIDKHPNWETALRRVSDSYRDLNFFVSSSSAKLSYPLLPDALRGRVISHEVLPLSWKEFLQFKNCSTDLLDERTVSRMKELIEEYVVFGGFPEVVIEENNAQKVILLNSYFETTVAVDIAEKYGLDASLVKFTARLLRKGNYYSASKMLDVLRSAGFKVGKETALSLERMFSESYYAAFLEIFSLKAKDVMMYPRKPYLLDNGMISFGVKELFGRLYENAVYVELRRRKNPDQEINYWKSSSGDEVDFVIREGSKIIRLIQVCYDLELESTSKREIEGLVRAAKEFDFNEGWIVNRNIEKDENIDGIKVHYIPLWKFLLG